MAPLPAHNYHPSGADRASYRSPILFKLPKGISLSIPFCPGTSETFPSRDIIQRLSDNMAGAIHLAFLY
jgi:hypothetical protein